MTPVEWKTARAELLAEEKALTKKLAEIAARRRQLPAVKVENPASFVFLGPNGEQKTLLDLFEDRQQLIIYDFMLYDQDKEGCPGCSFAMDHIPHLGHLHHRDTTFAAVAPTSIEKINAFKERMGWNFPFYSSKNTFVGAGVDEKAVSWRPEDCPFGIAVFLRDGNDVFHTYSTTMRGVENILSTYALLDMTHLGRQEGDQGMGFRLHDQY